MSLIMRNVLIVKTLIVTMSLIVDNSKSSMFRCEWWCEQWLIVHV